MNIYVMYYCAQRNIIISMLILELYMGRSPCCDESGLKKGPWTPEEDEQLVDYISRHGHGSWRALPKLAGLNRCGKSCRLRWTNYLRPDIKRGSFSDNEERLIINLHSVLGNKWSAIATRLPGRTDNEIKNFWNTHLKKKLLKHGIDPITHKPRTDLNNILGSLTSLFSNNPNGVVNLMSPLDMNAQRLQADAAQLAKLQILQSLIHVLTQNSTAKFGGDNLNNRQFNGLLDSSTCCTQHPCPKPSSLTYFGSQQFSASDYNLSEILDSCACLEEQGPSAPMNGNADSKMMMGTNCYNSYNNRNHLNCTNYHMKSLDGMPSLISASPEHDSMHQMIKEKTIRNGDSTHCSTATLFEGTLDGQASDYCWTDIMEQASSSSNWAMGAYQPSFDLSCDPL